MHSKRIREKVKKDYEAIAATFAERHDSATPRIMSFKPYIQAHWDVLDLGCGDGRLLNFLKETGFHSYVGVDQSAGLLAEARKKYPKAEFIEADMTDLPSFPKLFDAVFMMASLHHLPPADQKQVLAQVHSLLKPGGQLFLTNWNLYRLSFWKEWLKMLFWPRYGWKGLLIPWRKQAWYKANRSGRPLKIWRYYYAFRAPELRRLLEASSFHVKLESNGLHNLVTVAQRDF